MFQGINNLMLNFSILYVCALNYLSSNINRIVKSTAKNVQNMQEFNF